jgi:hypothetical protein
MMAQMKSVADEANKEVEDIVQVTKMSLNNYTETNSPK